MSILREIKNGERVLLLNETLICIPTTITTIEIPIQPNSSSAKSLTLSFVFSFGAAVETGAHYDARDDSLSFEIPLREMNSNLRGFYEPLRIGIGHKLYDFSLSWLPISPQQFLVTICMFGGPQ